MCLTLAEAPFPTSMEEINSVENNFIIPLKQLNEMNLQQLNSKANSNANLRTGRTLKKNNNNKRKLDLNDIQNTIASITNGIADKFSPIGQFAQIPAEQLGVTLNRPIDKTGLGLGMAAFATGLFNSKNLEQQTQDMMKVLENKYHLNNLFLDSIEKQNVDAQFSGTALKRTLKRVTGLRKSILAKIHAVANPLN